MGEKLLLVEDEAAIQSILAELLVDAGYRVEVAGDGLEGITKFREQPFALVLLDILLPKIDGYTLCEMIRRESDVPVIMLTALDEEEAQVKAFQLKADDYITKPFSLKLVLMRVEAVLRRASSRKSREASSVLSYAQMTLEEGEITQAAAPVVSQESIDQILAAAQGQVKAYNTEQYGYAKSQQLHFLPGAGDSAASNMGQVTAVRDSQLLDVFREEEYTLLAGRHIQPEDQGAILISAELAAENGLSVGDSVTLTHAGLGQQDGEYLDTIPEKTAFAQVEGVVAYSAESQGGYYGAAVDFQYFPGAFNIDYTGGHGQPVPYTVTYNSALSEKFLNGTYTLLEGRHIQPEDSFAVLLSKELTDKNGLSVGDSVTMYDLDTDSKNTFTIMGIFGGTEGMTKDAMMADGIAANQGYIDGNSYRKMWNETTLELGSLDMYVDSAQRVQQVLEAIQALPQLRGKTFTYSTDTEQFDLISTPLSSLQRMMDAAVAGIAVTGAVLAALLLLLWTRGRKREVGIFLALGKGKGEILLQFFAENLLLALPAGAAALGLAALLGERAGDILAAANGVEGLDVAVRFQDAAAVYGLGALLLALAVLLAAATVLRCKPKDILSQME